MLFNFFVFKVLCCYCLSSGSGFGFGSFMVGFDVFKDGFMVFVEFEFGDDYVGGVDVEGDGGIGGFFVDDVFDVDDVFEVVDGGDFVFFVFLGVMNDGDFVVFVDGDGVDLLRLLII